MDQTSPLPRPTSIRLPRTPMPRDRRSKVRPKPVSGCSDREMPAPRPGAQAFWNCQLGAIPDPDPRSVLNRDDRSCVDRLALAEEEGLRFSKRLSWLQPLEGACGGGRSIADAKRGGVGGKLNPQSRADNFLWRRKSVGER